MYKLSTKKQFTVLVAIISPFWCFLWCVSKYLPHVITVHEQGKSKDENGKGCVKPKRDLEQYVFKPLEKTGDGEKKRGKIKVKHRQNKANTKKHMQL